jgi:hypothetical protein
MTLLVRTLPLLFILEGGAKTYYIFLRDNLKPYGIRDKRWNSNSFTPWLLLNVLRLTMLPPETAIKRRRGYHVSRLQCFS